MLETKSKTRIVVHDYETNMDQSVCNALTFLGHGQLSEIISMIVNWPHNSSQVFLICFVLAHTLCGELFRRSPIVRLFHSKYP